jgi:hypothetical protein
VSDLNPDAELARVRMLLKQSIEDAELIAESNEGSDLCIETYTLIPVFSYRTEGDKRHELIGGTSESRKPREHVGTIVAALAAEVLSMSRGVD